MLLLLILALHAPPRTTEVDIAEINRVCNAKRETKLTQIILWRWCPHGPAGADHYVTQWEVVRAHIVERSGQRYVITWQRNSGEWQRVSARTLRYSGPARIDPEVDDRERLAPELRIPYSTAWAIDQIADDGANKNP